MTMTAVHSESAKTKTKAKARAKAKKRARAQKVVPNRDATVNVVGGVADYDDWVAEAKRLIEAMQYYERKLGELADRVETKYDEEKLAEFARDIGVELTSVIRWRSVYRAYKDAPKEILEETSPGVLQALQGHPGRYEILEQNHDLTVREARTRMKDYRLGQGIPEPEPEPEPEPAQQEPQPVIESRRWFTKPVTLAKMAVESRCGHVTQQRLDPDTLRKALTTPELDSPEQVEATLRAGGEELITLADKLKGAMLDDADAAKDYDYNLFIRRMNTTWYDLNMDIKKWCRVHNNVNHDALIKQLYAIADSMMNFANDLQQGEPAAPISD
jgi:hypothetical protein